MSAFCVVVSATIGADGNSQLRQRFFRNTLQSEGYPRIPSQDDSSSGWHTPPPKKKKKVFSVKNIVLSYFNGFRVRVNSWLSSGCPKKLLVSTLSRILLLFSAAFYHILMLLSPQLTAATEPVFSSSSSSSTLWQNTGPCISAERRITGDASINGKAHCAGLH